MANNRDNFIKAGFKIISPIFLVVAFSSCASVDTSSSGNALSYVKPLIKNGSCGNGKGLYNKIKNSHDSKIVVVTIETDMSPDPNDWYPSQRDFNLKPNQLRILGCSIVDEGAGKTDSLVSHRIVNARFQ
jgi:hypothetical protein